MTSMLRRMFVVAAAALAACGAWGQSWPDKPVRVVVAFTAGGTTDILARSVGQQLGERLKQPFVIDNKPGAGGNLGTEMVVRAPADGYTLIVNSVGPIAVNPTLYPKLAYNPLTDLVPIVQIADVPNVLVVHPSLPVEDLRGVRRLREGKSGQTQLLVDRHRHQLAPELLHPRQARRLRRGPRALQGRRGAARPARRARAVHVRDHPVGQAAHRRRQPACDGGQQRGAVAFVARRADDRRARLSRASRRARGSASSRPRARRKR